MTHDNEVQFAWSLTSSTAEPGGDLEISYLIDVTPPNLNEWLVEKTANALIPGTPLRRDGTQALFENFYIFENLERPGRFRFTIVKPKKD